MRYSYNWLRALSGTKKTPAELAELLTMKSFEVEEVEKVGKTGKETKFVVIGQIESIEKHPSADKLQIVRVRIGKKAMEVRRVVCGAWNIAVGDKVPVALPGAKLPNGLEIKEAEIRGARSAGMLCAEDELGLGEDHGGILILEKSAPLGFDFFEKLELGDNLMEIKVLPDRAHDALSHFGMAREICALEGRILNEKKNTFKLKKGKKLKLGIRDEKICSRYMGALVENVRVENSDLKTRYLLKKFGINPINFFVDATNLVMLESGQPTHAFDFDKISGKVETRLARRGEKIKLLDGKEYVLSEDDIVIADEKKVIALAGIMGGAETAVSAESQNILFEAANFNPVYVRKTRVRLGILTDASIRFEKGLDSNLAEKALALILEKIISTDARFTESADVYPKKRKAAKINLSLKKVNALLGAVVPVKEAVKILNNLGMKVLDGKESLKVEVPTFRLDILTEEDLIEEIGRIFGYEKIKAVSPQVKLVSSEISAVTVVEKSAKKSLATLGFMEVYNYSFYGEKDIQNASLKEREHCALQNPMNPEQSFMRSTLLVNLTKSARQNLKHFSEVFLFETGSVYCYCGREKIEEKKKAAGIVVLEKDVWADNFFQTKGLVENFLDLESVDGCEYIESVGEENLLWHTTRCAEIRSVGGEKIGLVGEAHPLFLKRYGIKKRAAFFELDLEKIGRLKKEKARYRPLQKFPLVRRDVALIVPIGVKAQAIIQLIKEAGGEKVFGVEMFDIFDLKNGSFSFAFHLSFAAIDRTLESGEVDVLLGEILRRLEEKLAVKIRA